MKLNLLYVTFPSEKDALELANQLLTENHIVCANLLAPIQSIYNWEGQTHHSTEIVQILKVLPHKTEIVSEYISKHHPYDAPPILLIESCSLNKNYSKWAELTQ